MIQIGNKTADAYYVGSKLVSQIYKGSTKIYPSDGQIPKSIKDSMMLWYDIKRQGATNESMKANPKLIDLSGNGHDITCYNFAWSGMSGIGRYVTNFIPRESEKDVTVLGTQKWRVNTIIHKEPIVANSNVFTGWNKTVTIVVDGLTDGSDDELLISHTTLSAFLHNGENVVTFGDTVADQYVVFKFLNTSLTNVTIEILPEYPNALVADGVDDYALVEGLPLLTKDRGFTVIYKRTILGDPNDAYKVFAAKRQGTQDADHWGAFTIEKGPNVYSFGQINEITINTDDIGYMTPTGYCGQSIQSGNQVDYDHLALFCGADNGNEKQSVALYSFILFDRTLTKDEVDWVKTNLIEGDTEL